jgi:hypothetical protein
MRVLRSLVVSVAAAIIAITLVSQPVLAEIISGIVRARSLPSATSDGSTTQTRLGRYGELFAIPLTAGTYGLADEGSYFHAMTATPGTAYSLTGATQTSWVATTPTFVMRNTSSEVTTTRMYLDFVRVVFATAGTAGTRVEGAAIIDNGDRYTSGGTALTAYNLNADSSGSSGVAELFAGAITAPAAITPRYTCRFTLKTAIPAVGDTMLINFGAITSSAVVANSAPAATCPPVVLGGNDSVLLYLWLPSQTAAPTGEIDAGWWER